MYEADGKDGRSPDVRDGKRSASTKGAGTGSPQGPADAVTIREACLRASSFLRDCGVDDHASSAEWLLQHALGLDRSDFLMRWGEPFPMERHEAWRRMLERRAQGEPVQYITGEQEFYGLPFRVTPAVLIPRQETELLVEQIVKIGRRMWPNGGPLVADIGCGSGAIPVTIAVQCPGWNVTATDISADAVEVARANAEANGVGDRIRFYTGDLLEAYVRERIRVDILVSNPPYIESADIAGLQREVRLYEPMLALDGGPDGLRFYRRILEQIRELPAPPALIGFELGQGQARAVAELLRIAGHWDDIRIVEDLAGIERHVIGSIKFS
ncbi:peptide chain release factor N(5)-glutamine methyltransferase [Paenibacillus flagellatus]|uniref:Release factor glutamine methyltransferase n=1 Tax=Paenibacillus flagellatus TaxID=2211139 RepID=A0A2V5KKK5_9BACL|nr:peptide chain release factor N(5)-glutamine methyltransferase [Paenibacillus flagellatus]PYI51117.1 peptide chain release factor N(5)-glutamine methyltransferase [Paenibacillus flagellatus]